MTTHTNTVSVLSPWFAHLTPWIDDAGSKRAEEATVSRYVAIVERWHTLTPERDQCLKYAVRALAVREAMRHTIDPAALAVCERVATLCEGVAAGGAIDAEAFVSAAEAADAVAAARVASWVTATAAAAEAASWATGVLARAWPVATSAAASWATGAAKAAKASTGVRAAVSADRLIDAILGVCERELELTAQVRP
jgi:leucyl aminopeptidase (aminopeptidase T)